KITAQDRAILNLKLQRDKLQEYQTSIQVVLDREKELATLCLQKGDRRRALLALRKRKYQEQLLNRTDEQLMTLEQLVDSVEFALVQKDVVFGLEEGNRVLKQLNAEMNMERIEKLMDETADGIAYQEEISDLMARSITKSDEEEIESELKELEQKVYG
ncbi:hypothetical protein CANCADRAFT_15288, partial [Tortispora caseinolytica NRRL Y-17796]